MSGLLNKIINGYNDKYSEDWKYHKDVFDEFCKLLLSLNTQNELIDILVTHAQLNVIRKYSDLSTKDIKEKKSKKK